jgi:hypothetical protein
VKEEIDLNVGNQIQGSEYIMIETMPKKKVKLFLIQDVDDKIALK